MQLKIILTGATGYVGEGVLLTCLDHPQVAEVLMVNRKYYDLQHPKLRECLVPDFAAMSEVVREQLGGYDACCFCAGISSVGVSEADYIRVTYDTTLAFARQLLEVNPAMVFNFVSGHHTDSTEEGRVMWARVKGKTENALRLLPFKGVYSFRPGYMHPVHGQRNMKPAFRVFTKFYPLLRLIFSTCTLEEVGKAMIRTATAGYKRPILEIADIKAQAKA